MLLDFNTMLNRHNMNVTGVIHIGGHHGQEYDTYRECDSIDKMVFFEPDPDSFAVLKSKTEGDDNVTIINKALGPFTCKADMNKETANEGQSSGGRTIRDDLARTRRRLLRATSDSLFSYVVCDESRFNVESKPHLSLSMIVRLVQQGVRHGAGQAETQNAGGSIP